MKVLLAVDDSDASQDAVAFAKRLLSDDSEAIVVNVARSAWSPYPWADPLAFAWEPITPIAGRSEEAALAIAKDAAEELDDAETVVSHGDPGAAICRVADEQDVDLIVLGTHDRGLWSRMWFGSVSSYVVDHAPCPVVVVR